MRMWSYTFIIRLDYSLLSLPMLALRKSSHCPKKTWSISYFLLHFFKIPNEKCLKLDLSVKQIAHLYLGKYNYFPLFFTILTSILNAFISCFFRILFIPHFRQHVHVCEKAWSTMVLLPRLFLTDGQSLQCKSWFVFSEDP